MLTLFDEHFFKALILCFVFGIVGILFLGMGVRVVDKFFFPNINFIEELKKGNLAVGIVVASIVLGIALIVNGVTN